MNRVRELFLEPAPVRKILRGAIRRLNIGNYRFRLGIGAILRPHYGYLLYQAAQLAAALGEPRVSVLEFGVAGGAGLMSFEHHAQEVEKLFPVKIDLYGFDTGAGLPPPLDYRDLPYHWQEGFFEMDVAALKARLKTAKLVIGDVRDTLDTFFDQYNPAPVGAVSFDLDYYSSTVTALKLFDDAPSQFLPRVYCYFDDVFGGEGELHGDYTGERLAIREFNDSHERVKLSPIYYLHAFPAAPAWHYQMWSAHLFDHRNYNRFVSPNNQQLPI